MFLMFKLGIKMSANLQNVISCQPEVQNIEHSIFTYMNMRYPDEKLPKATQFFDKLLCDNEKRLLKCTLDEKVAVLFSTVIPLIQVEIARSEQLQESCRPLKTKFHPIDIQTHLDQIIRDCLWAKYKAFFECAIAPLFEVKPEECVVKTSVESLSSLVVSAEVKKLFNEI